MADLIKLLAVASAGHGKTRFVYSACFVPEMSPILGINMGGNPRSVRDYPQDKLKIINVESEQAFVEIGEWLFAGQPLNTQFAKRHGITEKFKTLVIDGITEFQRRLASSFIGLDKAKFGQMPSSMPKIQDYGYLLNALLEFGFQAFDASDKLGINVLVTCLEDQSELGEYKLSLTGQAAAKLPAYPEIVCRIRNSGGFDDKQKETLLKLAKEQGETYTEDSNTARFKPAPNVEYPKFQLVAPSLVPAIMINPTMAKVWKIVNSK